jgi:hypothetical protein
MPATDTPPDMGMTPPSSGEQNDPTPITPSAGCGGGASPTGQLALTIRGNRAEYLVNLPPNYSSTTPSPLIFGFMAAIAPTSNSSKWMRPRSRRRWARVR